GEPHKEASVLELSNRGVELTGELGIALVLAAQPDVVQGELLQVERPFVPMVEPLVEKAINPLRGRERQAQVEVEVELLEVPRLEAPKDVLVPGEPGQGQFQLPAGSSPPRGQFEALDDVEADRGPAALGLIPPRVVVVERDPQPAVERQRQPLV